MKIIQEESVFEDGEKFYCINFDDGTYVCLTEDGYYDLLEIIENGNQSDLNNFIKNSSTRNISNSSSSDIGNIGMLFSIILSIAIIWICVKIWYYIPLIIGILTSIMGFISLIIGGIINHKFPHPLWAILYGIGGAICYYIATIFLLFMSHLGHIGMTIAEVNNIHEATGFSRNINNGFTLTIISAFVIGAYHESVKDI